MKRTLLLLFVILLLAGCATHPQDKLYPDVKVSRLLRVIEEKITEKEEKIQSLSYCPECKGKVSIEWGAKYKNYYWHCCDCKKNFPINHKCPQCQQKLKVRKQKAEYHIYCEPCHLSALYFEAHLS